MGTRMPTYNNKIIGRRGIPRKVLGKQPICHSQQGKGEDKSQEDDHEADVRTKCTDEEDKRYNSHENEEEACADAKMRRQLSAREHRQ